MPLFGNKFSPKKAPVRKSSNNVNENLQELVSEQREIRLKLDDHLLVFENGEWVPESGDSGLTHKSNQKLRKKIQDLQEENNLLKVKYELMLNMLTQTTAESHIQEKELDKLRKGRK